MKEVHGDEVRCTALNDAHMDGLLTVIHSEKGGDGMSSMQTDLPLLTDHDEEAIKIFIKEFEVCSSCGCHQPFLARSCNSEAARHLLHVIRPCISLWQWPPIVCPV